MEKVFRVLFVFLMFVSLSQETIYSCENCLQFSNCRLPNCSCCGNSIPGKKSDRPQIVYFSFDDAVTVRNYPLYIELFNETRVNPNGCPISMTLFVSHNNTDYRLVKNLYDKGMDIAVHGINHIRAKSIQQFTTEALGQRDNIAREAKIPKNQIVGYRSPYLIAYGNKHFEILKNAGMKYDSTLTITKRSLNEETPFPFTLDNGWPYPCSIPKCPTGTIPGFWELPVVSVVDGLGKYPCVYVDGCINEPLSEDESYTFLLKNFRSHYNKNKAPFGLNMHSTWLLREYETNPYRMRAMKRFLDFILNLDDVYIVNMKQMMEWMRVQPTLKRIPQFPPFQCNHQSKKSLKTTSRDLTTVTTQTPQMETIQNHIPVSNLQVDFIQEQTENTLHKHVVESMLEFGNQIQVNGIKNKTIIPKRIKSSNDSLNTAIKRQKRSPNYHDNHNMAATKSEYFKNQPKTGKKLTNEKVPFLKKGTRKTNRNIASQKHKSNVFRLMAKLTIGDTSSTNMKLSTNNGPGGSPSEILVQPAKFSHNKILVDPRTVDSVSGGQVVLIHNKDTAQKLLNKISTNRFKKSGSGATVRKLDKLVSNHMKTPKVSEPPATKQLVPQVVATPKYPRAYFYPKPNRPLMFGSKTFPSNRQEKSLGISHRFTNEIFSVNKTSNPSCEQGVNCYSPGCQCKEFHPRLEPNQIPQFVYITYEGSVNKSISEKLLKLFSPQRTNSDGCRIKGTVFVTSEGSNYTSIQNLHREGLEIALHGLKTKSLSSKLHSLEVAVQKYLLKRYARIPGRDIKGWRSSGLQSKGDDQFKSLKQSNLLYDASLFVMTNLDNRTGMWPFTLDFGWQNNCMLQDCPTQSYPGLWEVPAVPYVGIKKRYLCKYVDSCYNQPKTSVQTYDFLLENFMGIYKGNRKPFGVRIRNEWFTTGNEENLKGLDAFIELLQELADVYIVGISDLISWMKNPVPHLEGKETDEVKKLSC